MLGTESHDLATNGKQFLPEEGFTALEAQEGLLSFLVNSCHQILHDIPKDTMTSGKCPIKPEPQIVTESEQTCFLLKISKQVPLGSAMAQRSPSNP